MMVGLDCEAVRIVVIDLDRNKAGSPGSDGVVEFKKLCAQHEIDVEGCLRVETPSGGQHLYFADVTGRWGNTASSLAPGVDTRGVGGFIVAPGSSRRDGLYVPVEPRGLADFITIVSNGSLSPPPRALAELLDAKCQSKKAKQSLSEAAQVAAPKQPRRYEWAPEIATIPTSQDKTAAPEGWTLATAEIAIATAKPGTRNQTMSSVAFTMGLRAPALGLTREVVVKALTEAARGAGWDDDAAKTRDTAERQFAEGLSRALAAGAGAPTASGVAAHGAAAVNIAFAVAQRDVMRATEQALGQLAVIARRDLFKDVVVLSNGPNGILPPVHEGPISDNACRWLAKRLRDNQGVKATWSTVYEALADMAEHNVFNPVVEWLDDLEWDGVSRLDTWLPTATGGEATPLTSAAGVLVLQGMVMRARWPGSKFDTCLVLEGPQGLGKSSLAVAMCEGPGAGYFCDPPGLLAMDGKSRGEQLRGKWLVELAELAGLRRREAEEIKAFLSLATDQYRPAYGRVVVEQLRTAVFIGTTNAPQYLQDVTGNRRFVPVACKKIELSWFRQNRDQLFAEADARVRALAGNVQQGRPLPPFISEQLTLPKALWADLEEMTEERREASPLEIQLPAALHDLLQKPMLSDAKGRYVPAKQLIDWLTLNLPKTISTSGLSTQMKRLGWECGRVGKERTRVYYAPAPANPSCGATEDRELASRPNGDE